MNVYTIDNKRNEVFSNSILSNILCSDVEESENNKIKEKSCWVSNIAQVNKQSYKNIARKISYI